MKKKIVNISLIIVGILVVSVVGTKAATAIQSSMVTYNGTTVKETLDDLVDITVQGTATAEDITTGKTAVVQGKLITGTKKEQKFENIYYYDKNTEGDNIVRYIKVGNSYYPCDENGTQTSTTPLSGTITIVSKTDTSTPSDGEIQLVKYESMTSGNVSAGAAGFNEQSLILGSGSDNIKGTTTFRHNYITWGGEFFNLKNTGKLKIKTLSRSAEGFNVVLKIYGTNDPTTLTNDERYGVTHLVDCTITKSLVGTEVTLDTGDEYEYIVIYNFYQTGGTAGSALIEISQ